MLDGTSTSCTDTPKASTFVRSTSDVRYYDKGNSNSGIFNASTSDISTPNKSSYSTPCPNTSSPYTSTTGTSTSSYASTLRTSTLGIYTLTEVLSVPAASIPTPSVLIKDVSKVVIPEEFVSPNEVVTHKNLMLTHLPNKVLHHDMT